MSLAEMFNATSALGDAYGEGLRQYEKRTALAKLGEQLKAGDYSGAASTAFDAGDAGTGIGLLKLGAEAEQRKLEAAGLNEVGSTLPMLFGGGSGGVPSPPAPGAALDASPPAPRMGSAEPFKTADPVAEGLAPHQKAFLNAIAGGESAGKYNIRYTPQGGATFDDLSKHPNIREPTKSGLTSDASGRYQFLSSTWNRLGGGDFSPANQDRRAIQLAEQDYRSRTGRDLNADLQSEGFSPRIQRVLAPTWEALKGDTSRHSATYADSLKRYGSEGAAAASREQQLYGPDPTLIGQPPAQGRVASLDPSIGLPPGTGFGAQYPSPSRPAGAPTAEAPAQPPVQVAQAGPLPNGLPPQLGPVPTQQIAGMPPQQRFQVLSKLSSLRLPEAQAGIVKMLLQETVNEMQALNAPRQLQNVQDPRGGTAVFDPRAGTYSPGLPAGGYQDVTDPAARAAAGVPADYRGVIQRGPDGQLHFPGKPTQEINLGQKVEGAYDTDVAKANAKTFIELQQAGRDAIKQKNTLTVMSKLLERPDFYSGTGGTLMTTARRAFASLGVRDADTAAPQELFASLANQSVLDKAGGSLGAAFSNADLTFIRSIAANPDTSVEGNKLIVETARRMADRTQAIAKMARDYAKQNNGRIDSGFDDEVARFSEKNPLFADMPLPALKKQTGGQPVRVSSPEEARKLPKGTPIVLPDGRLGTVP